MGIRDWELAQSPIPIFRILFLKFLYLVKIYLSAEIIKNKNKNV